MNNTVVQIILAGAMIFAGIIGFFMKKEMHGVGTAISHLDGKVDRNDDKNTTAHAEIWKDQRKLDGRVIKVETLQNKGV